MTRAKLAHDEEWMENKNRATRIPWSSTIWDLLDAYRTTAHDMISGRRTVTDGLKTLSELEGRARTILNWRKGKHDGNSRTPT